MRARVWFVPASAVAVALLAALPTGWIVAADTTLQPWRPWLGAVRVTLIVAAWIGWERLVGTVPGLPEAAAAYLRRRRHFWCGVLAAVELIVVRNAPGALWRLVP